MYIPENFEPRLKDLISTMQMATVDTYKDEPPLPYENEVVALLVKYRGEIDVAIADDE